MTIGFLIPADFAGSSKNDNRVLITCTKEKAGILGSGLTMQRMVAGACDVLKIPSIPFRVAIVRPLAA